MSVFTISDPDGGAPCYCPRCDRMYDDFDKLKEHVKEQHPDYDPYWYETHRDDDCTD